MRFNKKKYAIVLIGSGKGSTIESFCKAVKEGQLQIGIKALITDNPRSQIPWIAEQQNIPSVTLPFKEENAEKWDKELLQILQKLQPDLILLAGFLRKSAQRFSLNLKTES